MTDTAPQSARSAPCPPAERSHLHPPRLALVGDRSPAVQAHARIPSLVHALSAGGDDAIELYWLHSSTLSSPEDVAGFDGIWIVPGSPYEHMEGVLAAIEAARTLALPLLGTCGGFQHVLLEFARNVCGLGTVENAEVHPGADELLIVPLECSLLGEEGTVTIAPGTSAAASMGSGTTTERYFCRYGLNPAYLETLLAHGLVASGRDEQGDVRVVELRDHPFFVASLFQPELSSDATWVHPLITSFAGAVRVRAASSVGASS